MTHRGYAAPPDAIASPGGIDYKAEVISTEATMTEVPEKKEAPAVPHGMEDM